MERRDQTLAGLAAHAHQQPARGLRVEENRLEGIRPGAETLRTRRRRFKIRRLENRTALPSVLLEKTTPQAAQGQVQGTRQQGKIGQADLGPHSTGGEHFAQVRGHRCMR